MTDVFEEDVQSLEDLHADESSMFLTHIVQEVNQHPPFEKITKQPMKKDISAGGRPYSNTELSFWSPQMRISEIHRSVSINRSRFASDTVGFRFNTPYKYLRENRRVARSSRTHLRLSSECGLRGFVCPKKPFLARVNTDIRMPIYNWWERRLKCFWEKKNRLDSWSIVGW